MNNKQSGFTIIELIVVIALLGILSAVALPRFISVTDDAHDASVEGAGAGFATGIALLKAQVVANGTLGTSTANVSGYGDETLDVNANGYAVRTASAQGTTPSALSTATDCVQVWTGVFDANGPSVSTDAIATSGDDYQATTTTFDGDTGCQFAYRNKPAQRFITYNPVNGSVETTVSTE